MTMQWLKDDVKLHNTPKGDLTLEQKLEIANSKLASIELILIENLEDEYPTISCPSYDSMLYTLREIVEVIKCGDK